MRKYSIQDAKAIIHELCFTAENNGFPTRDSFMDMLTLNPEIAVQGYNRFGKIFFWNEASISLYGHRLDEAVNKDLVELIMPPEMHQFAKDMMTRGAQTGHMPVPSPCDLLHADGSYVTVYSGHLAFSWDDASTPELYCLDLPLETAD